MKYCRGRKKQVLGSLASCYLSSAVDCSEIQAPRNGTVQGEKTVFPSTLSFSCDTGFTLRGSRSRKCRSNGTWDGEQTNCEGKIIMYVE